MKLTCVLIDSHFTKSNCLKEKYEMVNVQTHKLKYILYCTLGHGCYVGVSILRGCWRRYQHRSLNNLKEKGGAKK